MLGNKDRFGMPYIPMKPKDNVPGPGEYDNHMSVENALININKSISKSAIIKKTLAKYNNSLR